jgi:hypothetical protein
VEMEDGVFVTMWMRSWTGLGSALIAIWMSQQVIWATQSAELPWAAGGENWFQPSVMDRTARARIAIRMIHSMRRTRLRSSLLPVGCAIFKSSAGD